MYSIYITYCTHTVSTLACVFLKFRRAWMVLCLSELDRTIKNKRCFKGKDLYLVYLFELDFAENRAL